MKESVLQLFEQYPQAALVLSLALSILVALAGVLPSVFITAANILFFGFVNGLLVSFLGEALGAVVAFLLYRKGFKKRVGERLHRFPKLQRLVQAQGKSAFLLVISLRLLPFVPSGLVSFAAAVGRMGLLSFAVSSSLGKIPALVMEAYAVQQLVAFGWQGKLILVVVAVVLIYFVVREVFGKTPNL